MISLSPRLKTISDMVSCDTILDVGTDHGKLPIYLVKIDKIKKAYASDLNDGPVKSCIDNVKAFNLENRIEVIKSDGLRNIDMGIAKTLCIAGMGGELIVKILNDSFDKTKLFEEIILQPMTHIEELKAYLFDAGYNITEEKLVIDSGKIYDVFKVVLTDKKEQYNEVDLMVSPVLIKNKDKLLSKFVEKIIKRLKAKITGINSSGNVNEEELAKYSNLLFEVERIYETSKNY